MGDKEFEEFRQYFDQLPQHIKAPVNSYTLVHGVDDVSPSSELSSMTSSQIAIECSSSFKSGFLQCNSVSSSDASFPDNSHGVENVSFQQNSTAQRKRRKLPEIPKQEKSVQIDSKVAKYTPVHQPSLHDELQSWWCENLGDISNSELSKSQSNLLRQLIFSKPHPHSLKEDESSPELSDRVTTDFDSGNSTAHSPEQFNLYGFNGIDCLSSISSSSSLANQMPHVVIFNQSKAQLDALDPTHRGLHKFIPRHGDEIQIEIGDPVYVQKEADDLWCEGINLRTMKQGIFPSAYVVDVEYSEFDPNAPKVRKERFILDYLGSIETHCHKGNEVLSQSVKKITSSPEYSSDHMHACVVEISDEGIRMVDKHKRTTPTSTPCHDYFYSLKHISFCGFNTDDHRYLGFVTKHPTLNKFACHIFHGETSTRPVAEAVGRAFQRFYQKFMETAYPLEDIYIE